ncbi:hypothetical protein MMC13_008042 [Lambiella insularis]|nr:hypothetical protein [Lambiella insularis]
MSTRCEQHERRHEAADASTAERVQRSLKKSKGQNCRLAGQSEAGPSNAPQRSTEQRLFPGAFPVLPPASFQTGSHSQIPITPPQSSTDSITKDNGVRILEEEVQDQQQVPAVQEEAQKGKQKQSDEPEDVNLITQLNQARDKSANLENELKEKDERIAELKRQVRIAQAKRVSAVSPKQAESFNEEYEWLRTLCREQEREKEELQETAQRE